MYLFTMAVLEKKTRYVAKKSILQGKMYSEKMTEFFVRLPIILKHSQTQQRMQTQVLEKEREDG
jgi:hypothetical protein